MMTSYSSNLFLIVLVCLLYLVSAGVRRRRQDFIFPDDTQPGGIPAWLLSSTSNEPPIFQPNPDNPTTPSPVSNMPGTKTTPTPEFLRCMTNCPTTSEYNPICGTNQEVYFNEQKFLCAQRCGADVSLEKRGRCRALFKMRG